MNESALNLGDLEIAVLEQLWASGQMDARAMHQRVSSSRRISLSTVQSALERLYRKGLLVREKVSHAYVYAPRVARDEVMARLVEAALDRFDGRQADGLLAAFAGYAERADEVTLDRLERLIAERKAALPERGDR